jgi:hypothetical protein
MGGKNETKISGLRFHESHGDVHIHDDAKSFKFSTDADDFREDVQDAFNQLKDREGIVRITGVGDSFYIMKQGRNITFFLMDNNSVKKKLQDFIRDI